MSAGLIMVGSSLVYDPADERFMRRCFELARGAVTRKELPFGSVIARDGEEISGHSNGVREARDVTRHAEVCAIVAAQQRLGKPSLDGCTLYTNMEPCVFCSYAIRETRISRVVFALSSPLMGGSSRWDVLRNDGLGSELPEVFGPAPEVIAGYMAEEADALLRQVAPMMWVTSRRRGLFTCEDMDGQNRPTARARRVISLLREGPIDLLRRRLFHGFGRGMA